MHFLVEGVIYAQRAAVESDSIEEIMERVAQGISIMPVSNRRYIFDGRKGQHGGKLNHVLSVETYLDGVGIERSDGARADYFLAMSADQAALASAILRGAMKNLLTEEDRL